MDFCFDSFHSSRGAQKRHTHITSVAPLGQLTSQYTLQKFAFGEEGEKRNQRCTAVTSSGRTRSPWPPERPSAGPGSRADLERSDHRDGSSGDARPLPAAPSQPASRFTRGSLQLATRIPLPPQTSVSVGRTEACVVPPPPRPKSPARLRAGLSPGAAPGSPRLSPAGVCRSRGSDLLLGSSRAAPSVGGLLREPGTCESRRAPFVPPQPLSEPHGETGAAGRSPNPERGGGGLPREPPLRGVPPRARF